jgi:hypothetical protein
MGFYRDELEIAFVAPDFLSAHSFIYGQFCPRRRQLAACVYCEIRYDTSMSGTRIPAPGTRHNRHCTTTFVRTPRVPG